MAIINESSGIISTGSNSAKVTVDMVAQVYGMTIPISSGQRAIYGRAIWTTEPKITTRMIESPMGQVIWNPITKRFEFDPTAFGGGRSGTWTSDVSCDFAMSFGYHLAPADERDDTEVLRMWVNDKLVYDAEDPAGNSAAIKFTVHAGIPDEPVDAVILADRGDLTPTYPNMIYITFRDWTLATNIITHGESHVDPVLGNFNNNLGVVFEPLPLPKIRVEFIDGMTVSTEEHSFTMLAASTIWEQGTWFDWAADTGYAFSGIDTAAATLHGFEISGELEVSQVSVTGAYTNIVGAEQCIAFDAQSNSFVIGYNGVTNTAPIGLFNAASGALVSTFGDTRANLHPSDADANDYPLVTSAYPWPKCSDMIYVNDGSRIVSVYAMGDTFGDFCLLPINEDGTFPGTVGATNVRLTALAQSTSALVGNINTTLKVAAFHFGGGGEVVNCVAHIPLVEAGAIGSAGQDGVALLGVGSKVVALYFGMREGQVAISGESCPADYGAGHTIQLILVDPTDHGFVVFESDGSNNWTATKFKDEWLATPPPVGTNRFVGAGMDWRGTFPKGGCAVDVSELTAQYAWFGAIPFMADDQGFHHAMNNSELSQGKFAYKSGADTIVLNLATGAYTTIASFAPSVESDFVYDSRSRKLYYPSQGSPHDNVMYVASIASAAGSAKSIGDYLRWFALKIGYTAPNIYVDPALTDPVLGCMIDRAYQSAKLFGDLGLLYDFQYFESEGKAKFVRAPRGDAAPSPVYDLTTDDLAAVSENNLTDNDLFMSVLVEPGAQVAGVTVSYDDFDQDYTWASATFFTDTESSGEVGVGTMVLDTPIIMHRSEAYKRATQISIRANATSDMHFFRLTQKYMRLEPADVVQITIPPFAYKICIDEATLNADLTASYSGTDYDFQDDIPEPTDTHVGVVNRANGAFDAKPVVLDIPLIRPTYNNSDGFTFMVAVQSYGQTSFAGSSLYAGPLNSDQSLLAQFDDTAVVGVIAGALPTTDIPFQTDETTVITVALRTGTSDDFDNTDATGLLDGSNAILVGNDPRELIFFRDVEVVNDKVVRLTGLLRGRRGTEVFCNDHNGGEQVILVRSVAADFTPVLQPQLLGSALLATSEVYSAHGIGTVRPIAQVLKNIAGLSAYPWAPCELEAIYGSEIEPNATPNYFNSCGGGSNVTQTATREAKITVTSNHAAASGSVLSNLIDGAIANNSTDSLALTNALTDLTLTFDFRPFGFKQRITGLTWEQSTATSQGTYDVQATNDFSAWTTLASGIDLSNSTFVYENLFTNPDFYWGYRLVQVGGTTSNTPWIHEIYFKTVSDISGNDLLITWQRRDRLGVSWITDPQPMSEETEEYEIEIYDGSTLVRTVTDLATPQYVYSAANQTTDGFTPPLVSLSVKVYQVSAVTGRGFAGEGVINVQ